MNGFPSEPSATCAVFKVLRRSDQGKHTRKLQQAQHEENRCRRDPGCLERHTLDDGLAKENDMERGQLPHAALAQALDQLEIQVEKVIVPLSYADELYALRNHIHLVRQKLPQV